MKLSPAQRTAMELLANEDAVLYPAKIPFHSAGHPAFISHDRGFQTLRSGTYHVLVRRNWVELHPEDRGKSVWSDKRYVLSALGRQALQEADA